MDVSKTVADGISIAGDVNVFPDSDFSLFLEDVFDIAAGRIKTHESKLKLVECDKKIAFTTVFTLVLEAAKLDVPTSAFSAIFEDARISSERMTSILDLYQENKEKIQLQLSLIGRNYDQIIDVDWRQDYVIKSNNCEKISEPSYVISLKTWNTQSNSENDITFGCTLEQLQDLVLKLKDATKCIERNAS